MTIDERGPVLLSTIPLKAFRLTESAMTLLNMCMDGASQEQVLAQVPRSSWSKTVDFLEQMVTKGVLEKRLDDSQLQHQDLPVVTVVVPVRNRPEEIAECLESLLRLNYPKDLLEVIVVDDFSTDGLTREKVQEYVKSAPSIVRLLTVDEHTGQSGCRNLGVMRARGEVIAFTDSDCLVEEDWLAKLTPYFRDDTMGVVGGGVDSYGFEKPLDKYEDVRSPLDMGKIAGEVGPDKLVPYIPTCNVLVRRKAFLNVAGFNETLSVGEDVDLIWRVIESGYKGWYVPEGRVLHKHRNHWWPFLRRRAQYATSEAMLDKLHGNGKKKLPVPQWSIPLSVSILTTLLLPVDLLLKLAILASVVLVLLAGEVVHKNNKLKKFGFNLPLKVILTAVGRTHLSFAGMFTAIVSRYYSMFLLLAGLLFLPLLVMTFGMLFLSCYFEYSVKNPKMSYLLFAVYYVTEMLAYQTGVWHGCLLQQNVAPLRVKVSVL
jgi:mycofactocin system glycosyltransferase